MKNHLSKKGFKSQTIIVPIKDFDFSLRCRCFFYLLPTKTHCTYKSIVMSIIGKYIIWTYIFFIFLMSEVIFFQKSYFSFDFSTSS